MTLISPGAGRIGLTDLEERRERKERDGGKREENKDREGGEKEDEDPFMRNSAKENLLPKQKGDFEIIDWRQ